MAPSLPCALAVGGLDPGGGAGIAADLRAFAAAGTFGCAAIAVLTVQSTAGLRRAYPVAAHKVTAQAEEVMGHQRVRAVKVGALGSRENVRAVARLMARYPDVPFVVDTPMRPTRGRGPLLPKEAGAALRDDLLPRATVVTLNVPEVRALLGARLRNLDDARLAAQRLAQEGPRVVLVKAGHMTGPLATDVAIVDGLAVELRARRLRIPPTHGSGCTLASLIAGRLAHSTSARPHGETILAALRWAKRVHHAALARTVRVGEGLRVLIF
jgi:hydroxymethylpyrimidine/phosphomethylpyrimidine kinase